MSSSIKDIVAEHTKFKTEFTAKAQNAMRAAFGEFFEANPEIDQVAWTQYTPYFNDGEACMFGVHDMFFTLANDEVDFDEIDHPEDSENSHGAWFWDDKGKRVDPIATQRAAFDAFTKSVCTLPDEIFLNAFGDHVRVVANKDGFDVQEYEHE